MKNLINYKEFYGSVQFNGEDDIFYGKIEGINDLITFEGSTVEELKNSFKEACEDYIELCKNLNKTPLKVYKGNFNVRINPAIHKKAYERAKSLGISMNTLIQRALEIELD